MYVCECGKEFDDPQRFNGHKSHCLIHLKIVGKLDGYISRQTIASNAANRAKTERAKARKQQELQLWLNEQHTCEHCGKVMTEKFGSGRFCSRYCANAKQHSDETKEKIRLSNLGRPSWKKGLHIKQGRRLTDEEYLALHTCKICGKFLRNKTKTNMCQNCLRHTEEGKLILSNIGKKAAAKIAAEHKHKPWQSRKIKSYPEQFFEKVLDNNGIPYARELKVKHNNSNYFLDFAIETNKGTIDLEIDGKQHTYLDRIELDKERDAYLIEQGYLIYRIPWNDIKSEDGKQLMKNKIDNFLAYYKNLMQNSY